MCSRVGVDRGNRHHTLGFEIVAISDQFPLILRDSDVVGAEVDHTVFGKCVREPKRQRINCATHPRPAWPLPNSVRASAIRRINPPPLSSSWRSCSLHVIPPTLALADPNEVVCHSTGALNAYCELVGGCRRRRIKGNTLWLFIQ